ncbi:MAG TPA: peptidase S8 [Clostridiaceae bacterium]|jgi:serine protease AprX|nr:peptidase S8 [Clostridiaceae bacterium]HBF76595.1 peptidase S8 [Clostridiaceae bacterium]HBG39435.1 peptidase S8 [Clostridiaceae bacterium]HBN29150.1 peptidase S8 [Clostridiaceae bacterium]HBX49288.1 peptidase S8 [Clostridiaceae bacterium]
MEFNEYKINTVLQEKLTTCADDKLSVVVLLKDDINNKHTEVLQPYTLNGINYTYESIPAFSANLPAEDIYKLSQMEEVQSIEYNYTLYTDLDTSKTWTGVDKAISDFEVTGNSDKDPHRFSKDDIVIAVIDTGIDENHVDFSNGKIIGWKDFINDKLFPYDDNGHGTHCSSIAAGLGLGDPRYKGVAPGAALIGLKALPASGSGSLDAIMAAIDWCIQNKDKYGIDIITMSMSAPEWSDGTDILCQLTNLAVDHGIVFCTSAGNKGPFFKTIGTPSAAEKVITVGTVADIGKYGTYLAAFSGRGPTKPTADYPSGRIKPDIVAPGVEIMAAKANSKDKYVRLSGTSMSAPFVAGVAALMLSANSKLSPEEVKHILTSTAYNWGSDGYNNDYGFGVLNAYSAIGLSGNFHGKNIYVPNHIYAEGTIINKKATDIWEFNVNSDSLPVALTLIVPNRKVITSNSPETEPDFDIYVFDPNGKKVASVKGILRQETIKFKPSICGIYKIFVYSNSYDGSYNLDLSFVGDSLQRVRNNS